MPSRMLRVVRATHSQTPQGWLIDRASRCVAPVGDATLARGMGFGNPALATMVFERPGLDGAVPEAELGDATRVLAASPVRIAAARNRRPGPGFR
jgi:hypothetical protein